MLKVSPVPVPTSTRRALTEKQINQLLSARREYVRFSPACSFSARCESRTDDLSAPDFKDMFHLILTRENHVYSPEVETRTLQNIVAITKYSKVSIIRVGQDRY